LTSPQPPHPIPTPSTSSPFFRPRSTLVSEPASPSNPPNRVAQLRRSSCSTVFSAGRYPGTPFVSLSCPLGLFEPFSLYHN
ncbi:hypothetical protein LZ32DRAFT_635833, partial [Colletotrichum eremochloae]